VKAAHGAGEQRVEAWLAEPADVASSSPDEIVRKTVAALRSGGDPGPFLGRQRAAHLRRMRELTEGAADDDLVARLARDHLVAHLDADLRSTPVVRWRPSRPSASTSRSSGVRPRRGCPDEMRAYR
jgi:hypothetical protein